MRRILVIAVLAVGVAGCGGGGSGASKGPPVKITFGLSGGTMAPFSVTIAPGGAVTTNGFLPGASVPSKLSRAKDQSLSQLVRGGIGGLKSEQCAGTFPDESGRYITALGKTVTVVGDCEPGFTKLWDALTKAVGVNP